MKTIETKQNCTLRSLSLILTRTFKHTRVDANCLLTKNKYIVCRLSEIIDESITIQLTQMSKLRAKKVIMAFDFSEMGNELLSEF